jgi:hypothetical protein
MDRMNECNELTNFIYKAINLLDNLSGEYDRIIQKRAVIPLPIATLLKVILYLILLYFVVGGRNYVVVYPSRCIVLRMQLR